MGAAAADQTKVEGSNGELVPTGMKCNLRNLYEGDPDRRGRTSWTTKYPSDLDEPPENAESAQYALVARNKKCYDGRKKLRVESIVIQSPLLKKVLGVVLAGYPGITTSLERLEFSSPFEPFVHRWEQFAEAKETTSNRETNEHLNLLWEVLEEELRDTIREKKDLIANGVVTFDSIWTIFEPGSLVYTKEEGHDRIFRLRKGTYGSNQCGRFYALNVSYIDFDGENFGHGTQTLQIGAFAGTGPIRRLSAFPLAYHPDPESIKRTLIARGKVFEAYKGYHFKAYQGIAMGHGAWGPIHFSVDSRIIIDTYAYNRFNPNRKISLEYLKPEGEGEDEEVDDCNECDSDMSFIDGITTPSNGSTPLSEDQLLLCTPKLRGYSLKDKKWLIFFLHSVKDIVWNDQAFDSLVAPPEQKELILAFAQSQALNKQCFDDFIQGKGRGIIMLLSGPPGVGKTLTAESVAETMKVPLYMMSAGDLGTEPSDVESSLSNILEMNTKWNAVLLLDEADVFLEARSAHDLERNKLVSIFLRLLEYYEGILFLTTNRVDNIDAAFESRIHLSLQYDHLDQASRHHVWSTFLSRSSNVGKFSNQEVDKLAAVSLNGRQIKNILKTAQLLARRPDVVGMEEEDAESSSVPLVEQRNFGTGLWRKKPIEFVSKSTPAPKSEPTPVRFSLMDFYVKNKLLPATNNNSLAPNSGVPPMMSTPLAHTFSHLDRTRKGLTMLETCGWDPDSGLGLGTKGEGILSPVKVEAKNDTVGLGFKLPKVTEPAAQKKPQNLNARQMRKLHEEEKKKHKELVKMFYGKDDEDKYLGQ
ncbi:hypothetical protein BU16DRAFT_538696 [Lophium mytilinum]|uniref:G-patch domain-containing protein n=1 Tax=Lophium mytilinum TaxID=390894 RepID=A0A6A6QUB6_9PEZI|nr:hypothetical protein BU16DRAFT_538696 [Lophium mytilinum]